MGGKVKNLRVYTVKVVRKRDQEFMNFYNVQLKWYQCLKFISANK